METSGSKKSSSGGDDFTEGGNTNVTPSSPSQQDKDTSPYVFPELNRCQLAMIQLRDWFVTLVIGFLVVSYWRGTWTLFDIWLCGQPDDASLTVGNTFCFLVDSGFDAAVSEMRRNSGYFTWFLGLVFIAVGVFMVWMGWWRPAGSKAGVYGDSVHLPKVTPIRAAIRFITVYILGLAAVCTWRGVWYLTDYYILPTVLTDGSATYGLEVPLASWWTSTLAGMAVCYCLCAGAALLAPPAIFLIDGPGVHPPPIAVTIVSSYFSLTLPANAKPPKLPVVVYLLDILISFVGLPIMVVWYWRGCWMLLDNYLWGFEPTDPHVIHVSLGYGTILALVCMFLTSETVFSKIPMSMMRRRIVAELLGRLRTLVLAFGTVNFWRVVWYIWDEFFLGPSYASCWISHVVGVVALTFMGCLTCITAPPSTLGVDAVPDPDCAEEPLFSMLPAPAEALFLFGIGRQPQGLGTAAGQEEPLEDKHQQQVQEPLEEDAEDGGIEMRGASRSSSLMSSLRGSVTQGFASSHSRRSYYEMQRNDLDARGSVTSGLRVSINASSIGSIRSRPGHGLSGSITSIGSVGSQRSSLFRNR